MFFSLTRKFFPSDDLLGKCEKNPPGCGTQRECISPYKDEAAVHKILYTTYFKTRQKQFHSWSIISPSVIFDEALFHFASQSSFKTRVEETSDGCLTNVNLLIVAWACSNQEKRAFFSSIRIFYKVNSLSVFKAGSFSLLVKAPRQFQKPRS